MQDLEHYLQSYLGIQREYLGVIADLFEEKKVLKNEYLIKEGQYTIGLGFIQHGFLRIFGNTDGKEITQWISGPGDFITDLGSLIFNNGAKRNIQALSDVRLLYISKDHYQKIEMLIPQWNKLEKLFIAKCFLTMEDRIFSFLSMTAEERYQFLYNYRPELFHSVPLQYLASSLGMTPETFSRIRNKISQT